MKLSRSRILILLWLLLSALVAGPALAQSRAERETKARELFAAGRYPEALDIYTKLYAETPHPTYIRNIGRCYQNMGDADKAISSFREYLRQAKDLTPAQSAQIEDYIREMNELKRGAARAPTSPPSAPQSSSAPQPALPPPTSRPASSASPSGGESARGRGRPPSGIPAYVVGGGGLVALGVGGYFGLRAASRRHDSDAQCPLEKCSPEGVSLNNEAKTAARIADFAVGAGLVALGVATYLYFASPSSGLGRTESTATGLRLLPELGPSRAGLALGGSW